MTITASIRGQISTIKYIKDETGFKLPPLVRLVKKARLDGSATLVYDPSIKADVLAYCYDTQDYKFKNHNQVSVEVELTDPGSMSRDDTFSVTITITDPNVWTTSSALYQARYGERHSPRWVSAFNYIEKLLTENA